MKIGIIGTGNIGKTLAIKLALAGHEVSVANTKPPEEMNPKILSTGAKAFTAAEVVQDKEVVILSVPLNRIPDIATLFNAVPQNVTVIDTSNYYPARDGKIESIEDGQVESLWVKDQLGRTVAKGWNAILANSFKNMESHPAVQTA